MTLPAAYAWLADPGLQPPKMIVQALALYGLTEAPGRADNPEILAMAEEAGLADVYRHDETAWCGLFMAVVARRAGYQPPAQPLWALNWGKFGRQVAPASAALGDVLVFERRDGTGGLIGGHVGLYVGDDGEALHVLGGNTADMVKIARLGRGRLKAVRRPPYRAAPASVRPVSLAAGGAALSTNEA